MKSAVDLNELTERIRRAANRENGLIGGSLREISATSDLPPVPEPLSLPPGPSAGGVSADEAARPPEVLLAEAVLMLQRGRDKNAAPESVPKLLRPLYRNQGGVNGVLLEAVENLVAANRSLRQQNYELNERLLEFRTWAHGVAQASAENRDWMLVADARLQSLTEKRLAQLEERLARLETPNAPNESGAA